MLSHPLHSSQYHEREREDTPSSSSTGLGRREGSSSGNSLRLSSSSSSSSSSYSSHAMMILPSRDKYKPTGVLQYLQSKSPYLYTPSFEVPYPKLPLSPKFCAYPLHREELCGATSASSSSLEAPSKALGVDERKEKDSSSSSLPVRQTSATIFDVVSSLQVTSEFDTAGLLVNLINPKGYPSLLDIPPPLEFLKKEEKEERKEPALSASSLSHLSQHPPHASSSLQSHDVFPSVNKNVSSYVSLKGKKLHGGGQEEEGEESNERVSYPYASLSPCLLHLHEDDLAIVAGILPELTRQNLSLLRKQRREKERRIYGGKEKERKAEEDEGDEEEEDGHDREKVRMKKEEKFKITSTSNHLATSSLLDTDGRGGRRRVDEESRVKLMKDEKDRLLSPTTRKEEDIDTHEDDDRRLHLHHFLSVPTVYRHPTKPHLKPKRIYSIVPHESLWSNVYVPVGIELPPEEVKQLIRPPPPLHPPQSCVDSTHPEKDRSSLIEEKEKERGPSSSSFSCKEDDCLVAPSSSSSASLPPAVLTVTDTSTSSISYTLYTRKSRGEVCLSDPSGLQKGEEDYSEEKAAKRKEKTMEGGAGDMTLDEEGRKKSHEEDEESKENKDERTSLLCKYRFTRDYICQLPRPAETKKSLLYQPTKDNSFLLILPPPSREERKSSSSVHLLSYVKKEEGGEEEEKKKEEEKERPSSSCQGEEEEGKHREEQEGGGGEEEEEVFETYAYIVPLQNQKRILMKAPGASRDEGRGGMRRKRRRKTIQLKYRPLTQKEEEMREEKLQLLQSTKTGKDYEEDNLLDHGDDHLAMHEREEEEKSDGPQSSLSKEGEKSLTYQDSSSSSSSKKSSRREVASGHPTSKEEDEEEEEEAQERSTSERGGLSSPNTFSSSSSQRGEHLKKRMKVGGLSSSSAGDREEETGYQEGEKEDEEEEGNLRDVSQTNAANHSAGGGGGGTLFSKDDDEEEESLMKNEGSSARASGRATEDKKKEKEEEEEEEEEDDSSLSSSSETDSSSSGSDEEDEEEEDDDEDNSSSDSSNEEEE